MDYFINRNKNNSNRSSTYLGSVVDVENVDFQMINTETISHGDFQNIYAIHVRTEYACDSMPMKTEDRIFVIGDRRDIGRDAQYEERYWVDEKCKVIRYIDFRIGDDLSSMHAMEEYIKGVANRE